MAGIDCLRLSFSRSFRDFLAELILITISIAAFGLVLAAIATLKARSSALR
jgi:hypothetical protein